ncbi:MAG: hypothetical protein GXO04_06275 [Aquificae bacterium]|nr:hypothetical protein [Aquificota bacterium]
MEFVALFIIGIISGVLYNEHIRLSGGTFCRVFGFFLRIGTMGALFYAVFACCGSEGLFVFFFSHLLGRFGHLLFRVFSR